MLENSIYSILSPEGFATILWKDVSRKKEAAEIMKITAKDLKELEVIDEIIKEPKGGAHTDVGEMSNKIKEYILKHIKELEKLNKDKLIEKRYEKFRRF